jgi:hypothetical protein
MTSVCQYKGRSFGGRIAALYRRRFMRLVELRVEVERETDNRIKEWADDEGRSKTRHVGILMRRLAELRETRRGELERLGLLDPKANHA